MNNEKNNAAYFYVKSPDLYFDLYKSEKVFSDSNPPNCEYCEDTTTYDY